MITIQNQQTQIPINQQTLEQMQAVAEAAAIREGFAEADADITLVTGEEIQALNRDFRKVDAVTDVLSFPLNSFEEGEALEQDPETGRVLLGDIIICAQRAVEQAEEYGHSLLRELCFLTVHGMLHLMGYDHMTQEQETEMFEIQRQILETHQITRQE